jgi:hypothetical protein
MPRTRWDARLQDVEADITDIKIRSRPLTRCTTLQHDSDGETLPCVGQLGAICPASWRDGDGVRRDARPVYPRILPPRVHLGSVRQLDRCTVQRKKMLFKGLNALISVISPR